MSLTRADEIPTVSLPEVVEDPIPVSLRHSGMDVIAGIPEFCYFLRQKLHPLRRVAEYYRLIDLELKFSHLSL